MPVPQPSKIGPGTTGRENGKPARGTARMPWRIDVRAVLLALRTWTRRRTWVAVAVAVMVGVLVGGATVLIPNPVFTRDIPPVWWNVPVLVLMAALTGMLAATYVRVGGTAAGGDDRDGADSPPQSAAVSRGGRMGMLGTVLAWFAVGCPVCNKVALLALGYTGALTYFAPLQPILAVLALALTGYALLWRLQGMVVCPVRRPRSTPSA